jgi:hypothetical protein
MNIRAHNEDNDHSKDSWARMNILGNALKELIKPQEGKISPPKSNPSLTEGEDLEDEAS